MGLASKPDPTAAVAAAAAGNDDKEEDACCKCGAADAGRRTVSATWPFLRRAVLGLCGMELSAAPLLNLQKQGVGSLHKD